MYNIQTAFEFYREVVPGITKLIVEAATGQYTEGINLSPPGAPLVILWDGDWYWEPPNWIRRDYTDCPYKNYDITLQEPR